MRGSVYPNNRESDGKEHGNTGRPSGDWDSVVVFSNIWVYENRGPNYRRIFAIPRQPLRHPSLPNKT